MRPRLYLGHGQKPGQLRTGGSPCMRCLTLRWHLVSISMELSGSRPAMSTCGRIDALVSTQGFDFWFRMSTGSFLRCELCPIELQLGTNQRSDVYHRHKEHCGE
ncbi:hypothetical protein NDU88_009556 [Pleurodeles waltl]|uniref:Uncharacterized protein n=1 Tax=Pleurodeles waltl TaxID=8319 RepID=A0AAV7QVM3_PLEWA|nr:hypothetical protein NDU88_009556 [Pleurodeles waltl]